MLRSSLLFLFRRKPLRIKFRWKLTLN